MTRFVSAILLFCAAVPCAGQTIDTAQWNAEADRGRNAEYLSGFDKDVVREINKARSNPALYAKLYIEPTEKDFKGTLNVRTNVATNEGVGAVRECAAAMKKTAPLAALNPSQILYRTANAHTRAQSKTREVGHTSPNGKTFSDRIAPLKLAAAGECISYGEPTPRMVAIGLLVDDGVSNRGHRRTIFDPKYNSIAASSGGHLGFGYMSTLDFGLIAGN